MKKYIILTLITSLLFTACNPNKKVFEELDKVYDVPYSETGLEYTLSNTDYSTASGTALKKCSNSEDSVWAKAVSEYYSFNTKFTANDYVPIILTNNFKALKDGSSIIVNYNQYIGEMYGKIENFELQDEDYTAMGGSVATNLYFSETDTPDNYLPVFLEEKLSKAEKDNYAKVVYNYITTTQKKAQLYQFDGTHWNLVEAIVLTDEDYDQMGAPGKHNNFSEDEMPGDYLPQFLSEKLPYAQADERVIVVVDFYGYESSVYAISCIYDGSEWTINFPGLKSSAQFIHTSKGWLFDPTVKFAMTPEDYQMIVDYVKLKINADLVSSYGTNEYYTGASAYHNNFDIRISKRRTKDPETYPASLSDEDALELIWTRVKEGLIILLQEKYPDATPDVEGVPVNYFITFTTFDDSYSSATYTAQLKCVSAGSPATFELVGDIAVAE